MLRLDMRAFLSRVIQPALYSDDVPTYLAAGVPA